MTIRLNLVTTQWLEGDRSTSTADGPLDTERIMLADRMKAGLLREDGDVTVELLHDAFGAEISEWTGESVIEASLAALAAAPGTRHVVLHVGESERVLPDVWRGVLHSAGIEAVTICVGGDA